MLGKKFYLHLELAPDQTVYGKMWSGCDFRTSKMRMLARPGNVKIGPAVFTGLQMHLKQLQ